MEKFKNLVFMPAEEYENIVKMTQEIHSHLLIRKTSSNVLNDFITEREAMKEFRRKTTWFWNQRRSGKLPFKKVGSRVYYRKSDLLDLLNKNA
ncbi:helix-turn-helix domain-containing protein [Marinilabilia salmonicolor]|nr:helix-turn-helix domain-containing protein [Marinilabilia salmonicolor]